MKKLIFLLSLVLIVSCSKKEDPTTFQVVNDVTKINTPVVQYLDGSLYEVVVFHYKGSDIIGQTEIDKIASGGGRSEIIDIPAGCEKMKVSFMYLPDNSPFYDDMERQYVVAYTLVQPEKNNIITITGQTMVSESMSMEKGNALLSVLN